MIWSKLTLFLLNYKNIFEGPRIQGGRDVPDAGAPFVCSIKVADKYACGCVILSDRYILTAARCVNYRTNLIRHEVYLGTNSPTERGILFKSEEITHHDGYYAERRRHNIALVKVKGKIVFNDRVQPIELSKEDVPANATVQVYGFGGTTVKKTIRFLLHSDENEIPFDIF